MLPLFSVLASKAGTPPEGYEIKITGKGFKEGSTYNLGFYYGDMLRVKDSAKVGPKGEVVFKGKTKCEQGVYFIYSENKKHFDFIMDADQHFSLQTDTSDYVNSMKVKNSEENALFFDYQQFLMTQQKLAEPLRAELKKTKNKDSIKIVSDKLNKIDSVVKLKMNSIKAHPKTFFSKWLTSMDEPEIPEAPKLSNGLKDTLFPFRYYKAHFFDNIDFKDERMLYTPNFHSKIKQYMEKLTVQIPDSINVSADYLVEKARANSEVFKYVVYWLTLNYESSKMMGMDAVFVHMVKKYYATHQAYWVDSAQLYKITDRAAWLDPILIGRKAPAIKMMDTTLQTISLHDVKAKYTVLIFWDEDCGHCQKEVPKLKELYDSKLKAMGVEVYAVATEDKVKAWKKFMIDHQLHWINVHQPNDYERAVTKKIYDVLTTPRIFLLDENKIIKAKQLDVEQLEKMIDFLEKEKLEKLK
jgi:peroxiredoxin